MEKIDVNLDGRQIFCLFCGGAVIASLVFVLGVTVGRRVEAREHSDSIAGRAAADPLAALDQLGAEESSGGTELAFASALRGEREGDPLGPVDLSLDGPAVPRPESAARPEAAKPEAANLVAAPSAEAVPIEVSADAARFTLHLSSFRDRAGAEQLIARLKKAGYRPYMTESVEEGKGTWYRVRVGNYGSYEDAIAGKIDFEKKQSIIAYVTRTRR